MHAPAHAPMLAADAATPIVVHAGRDPAFMALAAPLISRKYQQRGYLFAPGHQLLPGETILLATQGGALRGTLTLGLDGPRLHAEDAYPDEVRALRSQGLCLTELTRLAVDAPQGAQEIMSALFSHAWHLGRPHQIPSCALIEVHPRHAGFYQRRFGFEPLGSERICRRANAPCVLLTLSLYPPHSTSWQPPRRLSAEPSSTARVGLTSNS